MVLVDSLAAALPSPFNLSPQVPCRVDMILSDPFVVSVQCGVSRDNPPFFSGTIQRSAILKVVPTTIPGGLQI